MRSAEAALRAAEEALAQAGRALAQAVAAHEARSHAAHAARAARDEARRAADDALASLGFGPEAARAVAMEPDALDALEATVRAHREQLLAARERRATLLERLGGARASAADVARASELALTARGALQTAVARRATLTERVHHLKAQLALAEQARARRESAKIEYDIHARLAEDLKSDKLQAFVLEEVLADLVRGASLRLKMLSGERYGLEADEKSGFLVVDNDNAGERRSTDTLSGGETFLASLALALELSEQIQAKAGKVHLESLFIDEGFGTLDPETLDTVATAIEGLGTSGRLVGLITHVAELSSRLPHKIRVERGPAGVGSTVKVELGA
ncbi:MAG: SMC family ATPase [Myxococcota bacterium]